VIEALDTPSVLKQNLGTDSMDGVFLQLARQAKRSD
jgi:hypothetical protein